MASNNKSGARDIPGFTRAPPSDAGTCTDTDSIYTPTHTATASGPESTTSTTTGAWGIAGAPEASGTYMIRNLDTGEALVLRNGELELTRDVGIEGGCCWLCEERDDGWLGFRESVSGRYLGRDPSGGLYARAVEHGSPEALLVRPLSGGGYHIITCSWWTLRRVGIRGGRFVEVGKRERQTAARWEFIEMGQRGGRDRGGLGGAKLEIVMAMVWIFLATLLAYEGIKWANQHVATKKPRQD
ncbi:hypothetical protein F4810DRAFT_715168 [Camillea tinctor]|nr:hypothetical protein F4810DRAFT_715168 [Camillea tinctor]